MGEHLYQKSLHQTKGCSQAWEPASHDMDNKKKVIHACYFCHYTRSFSVSPLPWLTFVNILFNNGNSLYGNYLGRKKSCKPVLLVPFLSVAYPELWVYFFPSLPAQQLMFVYLSITEDEVPGRKGTTNKRYQIRKKRKAKINNWDQFKRWNVEIWEGSRCNFKFTQF